jgi:hypothetical protein
MEVGMCAVAPLPSRAVTDSPPAAIGSAWRPDSAGSPGVVTWDVETSTESFTWVVLSGTGAYAGVRGSGKGMTSPDGSEPQTGNINTYTGFVLG